MQNNQSDMIRSFFILSILSFFFIVGCHAQPRENELVLGAARETVYLPEIDQKKVGLLVNHTSMVGDVHLVDFLLEKKHKLPIKNLLEFIIIAISKKSLQL